MRQSPNPHPQAFLWPVLLALAWACPPAANAEEIQDLDGVRVAVESFVASQSTADLGERTIEVSNLDTRLRLAACGEGLRTFFAPGSRTGSRRTVGVSCQTPKPWTIYVAVRIVYRGEVLVAARALPRGAVISAADLVIEERDLEAGPTGYLTDPYLAVGKRTARPVRLGMPLTSGLLEEVQVIQRGQRVWLLAEAGRLSVRMAGTALQSGAPGDRIRVQNSASSKVIDGVVGDDGIVRIGL